MMNSANCKQRTGKLLTARLTCGLLLFLALAACGGGGGGGATNSRPTTSTHVTAPVTVLPQALRGSIDSSNIASIKTGSSYPIYVYKPSDYATTVDNLPVIYTLDGGYDAADHFVTTAKLMEAQGIRGILVGIGNFARRDIDYTMPGAVNYYSFLTTELIPAIEPNYRVDTGTRTLTGHSYGGLFTLLALYMDRPANRFFANFIPLDGSFWSQTDLLNSMEAKMFNDSQGTLPGTTLVLSSAAIDGNDVHVETTHRRLSARNYQGLQLTRLPTHQSDHMGMFLPGMDDSLEIVFPR